MGSIGKGGGPLPMPKALLRRVAVRMERLPLPCRRIFRSLSTGKQLNPLSLMHLRNMPVVSKYVLIFSSHPADGVGIRLKQAFSSAVKRPPRDTGDAVDGLLPQPSLKGEVLPLLGLTPETKVGDMGDGEPPPPPAGVEGLKQPSDRLNVS